MEGKITSFGLQRSGATAVVSLLLVLGGWSQAPTCPAWTAEGNQAQARFGDQVGTAGDVNGDGFDDVIVKASQYTNDQQNEGRAFLYLGSSTSLSASPVWTVESDQAGTRLGGVEAAGDVNGDGYSDVIVGIAGFENGQPHEGRALVYLGSSTGPGASPAWTAESDQAETYFGSAVSTAGDVNGDGYDDVIVGAGAFENGQTNEGCAFVYLGSGSGLAASPGWTVESDQANALLGYDLTAGDVNGDGYDDVVVGAYDFDNGETNEGRIFLYLGSASGLSTSPAWTVEGDEPYANLGQDLAAGDVNGDGYSDVLVGDVVDYSIGGDVFSAGLVHAYLGSATGLATSPAWTAEHDQGDAEYGHVGLSISTAGDVNGDGYGDLVVGTPGYETELLTEQDEGRAYVYLGSATGLGQAAWNAEGNGTDRWFGQAVSTAGDVNGDGYGDVIIGSSFSNSEASEGRADVYLGSAAFVSSAVYAGDGINADTIAPVNAIIGKSWSAPLALGHWHGTSGPLTLKVRTTAVNGPNFTSPLGGRQTEFLVAGPSLTRITGSHNGTTGGIATLIVPSSTSLVGVSWAAQYLVIGGGFGDLSQAVHGVIGCP